MNSIFLELDFDGDIIIILFGGGVYVICDGCLIILSWDCSFYVVE